jgi:hypothetical protein
MPFRGLTPEIFANQLPTDFCALAVVSNLIRQKVRWVETEINPAVPLD